MPSLQQICDVYNLDIKKVELFQNELFKWAQSLNIVGINSLDNFSERHLLDSAQICSYISLDESILDIGSGAGFPGLILSFSGLKVTLVEKNQRKCIFLKHIIALTGTNAQVLNCNTFLINDKYDVVTSRAFSSLNDLLIIQKNVSRETTRGIYLKGRSYKQEIEEAEKNWSFQYKVIPSKTSSDGIILILDKIKFKNV